MQNRPKPSLNLPKSKPIYKELNTIKQRKTKNQPTPDRIFQKVDPFTKNWTKSNSVKCKTSQLTSNFSFREATTSGLFSSNSGGGGSRTGDSSRADLREILLWGGFDVVLRSDWVGMNVGDFRFQALAFEETLLGRSEEDGEKVNRRDAMTLSSPAASSSPPLSLLLLWFSSPSSLSHAFGAFWNFGETRCVFREFHGSGVDPIERANRLPPLTPYLPYTWIACAFFLWMDLRV